MKIFLKEEEDKMIDRAKMYKKAQKILCGEKK